MIQRPRRLRTLSVLLLALVCVLLTSCQQPAPAKRERRVELPTPMTIAQEPTMRVRIAAQAARVTLGGGGPLLIGPEPADPRLAQPRAFRPPVVVTREPGQFVLTDGDGQSVAWQLPALRIEPTSDGIVTVNGTHYPQAMVLVALADRLGRGTDRFDVINHVPLEDYLPGVLERELFGSWAPEAFAAQAIAARTYALFEQALREGRHYDMESTTASQVYGGQATNAKALAAVRRTRGQVLVYEGRVVPAFFSSSCGGTSQAATGAFPRHGKLVDIAPLAGGARGDWCRSSPQHRWGPIQRDTAALSQRIAAWGRANEHPVARLGTLRTVTVEQRSAAGRPTVFALSDAQGQHFSLHAEGFRFACNQAVTGLATLAGNQQLKSSHVEVRVAGSRVQFTDGRGYGHGVGLCQWGAQGMALQGYTGADIVRHYYPGAEVERVY